MTTIRTSPAPAPPAPTLLPDRRAQIGVLVVAGYPALQAGFAALLSGNPGIAVLDPGGDHAPPQVIVADAGSIDADRLEELAEHYPSARFVIVGGDPATNGPGLEAGPVAYLGPAAGADALSAAVLAVASGLVVIDPPLIGFSGLHSHPPLPDPAAGDTLLTAREREVLELVAAGLPNKTIAHQLGISEHTAKFHVGSLLTKLGAGSRTEAVTLATRRGLLDI